MTTTGLEVFDKTLQTTNLSAELPLLVRGSYFEGWRPGRENLKLRSLAEFLERVSGGLADTRPIGSVDAARPAFVVLSRHPNHRQIEKIRHSLPEDIRALWPDGEARPI